MRNTALKQSPCGVLEVPRESFSAKEKGFVVHERQRWMKKEGYCENEQSVSALAWRAGYGAVFMFAQGRACSA